MRSRLPLLGLAALLPACAAADAQRTCRPVASYQAPAFRCEALPPPKMIEEAPPPPPAEVLPPPVEVASIKEGMIEITDHIQFATDSADLLDQSKGILDEVARLLITHPAITKVQIEGHTDGQDTRKHNQALSEKRAAAVKEYLVDHGVDGKRLLTKGFGEDVPIADNETEQGRFQNRRVEFRIVERTDQ